MYTNSFLLQIFELSTLHKHKFKLKCTKPVIPAYIHRAYIPPTICPETKIYIKLTIIETNAVDSRTIH